MQTLPKNSHARNVYRLYGFMSSKHRKKLDAFEGFFLPKTKNKHKAFNTKL